MQSTLSLTGEGVTSKTFDVQRFQRAVADSAGVPASSVRVIRVRDVAASKRALVGGTRSLAVTSVDVDFEVTVGEGEAPAVVSALTSNGGSIGPVYQVDATTVITVIPRIVPPSSKGGLSAGGIAGVVIAVLVAVGLGGLVTWLARARAKRLRRRRRPTTTAGVSAWADGSGKGARADRAAAMRRTGEGATSPTSVGSGGSAGETELVSPFTVHNPLKDAPQRSIRQGTLSAYTVRRLDEDQEVGPGQGGY